VRPYRRFCGPSVADLYRDIDAPLLHSAWAWKSSRAVELKQPFLPGRRQARVLRPPGGSPFWRILLQADRVFQEFSSRFGKVSPGPFLLGSFDWGHAILRQTCAGRGADAITARPYSQESSVPDFWPGNGGSEKRPSICYAARPEGLERRIQPAKPPTKDLGELIYLYDDLDGALAGDSCSLLQSSMMQQRPANWDRPARRAALGQPTPA